MKLSEAYTLMPGDALLFKGTHPHSRVIEAYTGSEYSHVAIVAGSLPYGYRGTHSFFENVIVIEALEPKGVRPYPLKRYLHECKKQNCQVDWFKLDVCGGNVRSKIVSYAIDQVGLPYALKQLAWSYLRLPRLLRKVFPFLPTYVDHKHWFCSQLAAASYAKAGLKIPKMPALMTPQDVASISYLSRVDSLEPDDAPAWNQAA